MTFAASDYLKFSNMTFSEMTRSTKPVLIDFSAEWCGPCKALAPILEDVKRKVGDKASIYKIDVDRNPAIASSHNVMSVPTLIVFRKGKPVWRRSGVVPAAELVKVLEQYFEPVDAQ
jgi:thioredoxin 1